MLSQSALTIWLAYVLYSFGILLGIAAILFCVQGIYTTARQKNTAWQKNVSASSKGEPSDHGDWKTSLDSRHELYAEVELRWKKADSILTMQGKIVDRYLRLTNEIREKGISQTKRDQLNRERQQVIREFERINAHYKAANQEFKTAIKHLSSKQ